MAHEISVRFRQAVDIENCDLKITVKTDGEIFGTLTLSKGTIDWRPKKKWRGRSNEFRMTWEAFDRKIRS